MANLMWIHDIEKRIEQEKKSPSDDRFLAHIAEEDKLMRALKLAMRALRSDKHTTRSKCSIRGV